MNGSKQTQSLPDGEVAFGESALTEYREILTHYPRKRAALMPVLWLAQREFGFVGVRAQAYVAQLLDLPVAWVEGAVTFYTMYYTRPMGTHHLQVCTNLSCRLRGADEVVSAVKRRLDIEPGQTTRDGKFSLDCVECLGSCGTAPVLQIGSGRFVEDLTVEQALALVDQLAAADGHGG